ncbi:hypothetical protein Misp01_56870 [Microtetraspora sp. NBRC 13810]|nr:hypothetical protein Misp01_56870 [Microtetraspora sp. NBRC 13810]
MAEVVAGRDLTAPVPTCPGWDLAELVTHTGGVHRWAAYLVDGLAQRFVDRAGLDPGLPEGRDAYPVWLAEGAPLLSGALEGREGGTPMWAWGADRHVRWWSRRQLHETVVHRADAEIALGLVPEIDEETAEDGVAEFFDLVPRVRWRDGVRELTGSGETISWQAGTGAGRLVTLTPEGFEHEPSGRTGTVTVRTATAGELLLLVWGRRPASHHVVEGDAGLLAWWLARAVI